MKSLRIKRIYAQRAEDDGRRILVDRLWPRGVSKTAGRMDVWVREVSPSDELRKRFSHEPELWDEFRILYFEELEQNRGAVEQLLAEIGDGPATLLYAAKDEQHNNARALLEYLQARAS